MNIFSIPTRAGLDGISVLRLFLSGNALFPKILVVSWLNRGFLAPLYIQFITYFILLSYCLFVRPYPAVLKSYVSGSAQG